jgi:hypothetical protein
VAESKDGDQIRFAGVDDRSTAKFYDHYGRGDIAFFPTILTL